MSDKGSVKWFDGKKRYGMIVRERGADVFVHQTAITGGASLSEGDKVEFDVVEGPKGLQAKNVVKIA